MHATGGTAIVQKILTETPIMLIMRGQLALLGDITTAIIHSNVVLHYLFQSISEGVLL
jgi:hypothetical protein